MATLKSLIGVAVVFVAIHIASAQFIGMTVECKPKTIAHLVSYTGCTSRQISLDICEGTCRSLSEILMQKPWYAAVCQCCKRTSVVVRKVELSCNYGSSKIVNVPSVAGCKCQLCRSI